DKVAKMEEQGGHVFSATPEQSSAEPPEVTGGEEPVPSAEEAPPPVPPSPPAAGFRQDNFGNTAPRDSGYRRGPGQGSFQGGRGGQGGGIDRPREGGGQGGGYGRPREGGGYGRGGPRQGRGGNRGRFRGRGPGGGRDDRSLPSSKYVSHGGYDRQPGAPPRGFGGGASRPEAPLDSSEPPSNYEPIILPGESLAKYKNRMPGGAGLAGPLAAGAIPASAETVPLTEAPSAEEIRDEAATFSEAPRVEHAAAPPAAEEHAEVFEAPAAQKSPTEPFAAPVMPEERAPEAHWEGAPQAAAEHAVPAEDAPKAAEAHDAHPGAPHEENGKDTLSEAEAAAVLEAAEEDAQDATLEEDHEAHSAEGEAYPAAVTEDETDREIREG